jgi:hypothetical protein
LDWAPATSFGPFHQEDSLSSAQLTAIVEWSKRLNRSFKPQLQIAADRILSATSERYEPADILIDAVTAWENLVGTGQEITFRVSTALASLLRKRGSGRLELQKELQGLYRLRSAIVHGDTVKRATLVQGSHRAVEIAVDALRTLLVNHPTLVGLSSEARSDALILN